jgi:non-canonical (house-cleaning) NTP pyrophosphatase
MRVIVGSISERKVRVCRDVFGRYFRRQIVVEQHDALSGVSPTPHDRETVDGARNRARACSQVLQAETTSAWRAGWWRDTVKSSRRLGVAS